jgi:hypothetical protein
MDTPDGRVTSMGPWPGQRPPYADPKSSLRSSLRDAREALLSKLDGLSDYDVRRPLTPTGTNLLGLVKHLALSESRYLGDVFGRPMSEQPPWRDGGGEPEADMWVSENETRREVVEFYRRVWNHADATIDALDLDAPGTVPWWKGSPDVVLFNVVVHLVAETNRHAGHADILREQIRAEAGSPDLADHDAQWWVAYRARVERAARVAGREAL